MDDTLQLLTTLLTISVIIMPIIFGYLLWKMSNIFVRLTTFDEYKTIAQTERQEMKNTLWRMEENLTKVMLGVARLEGLQNGKSATISKI